MFVKEEWQKVPQHESDFMAREFKSKEEYADEYEAMPGLTRKRDSMGGRGI